MIIICDIDGTIADCTHRLHLISGEDGKKKDWEEFHAGCIDDKPIAAVIDLLNVYSFYNTEQSPPGLYEFWYITGRPWSSGASTLLWLRNHGCPDGILAMRPDSDFRHDYEVKRELLYEKIYGRYGKTKDDILFVLEDRTRNVQMWREEGLVCFQVQPGDY